MSETLKELEAFRNGQPLPAGEEQESLNPVSQVEQSANPLGETPTPQVDDSTKTPIPEGSVVVDGKTFATEKEAFEYVQQQRKELETEKMLLQARQEGFETAAQYQQHHGLAPQPQHPQTIEEPDDSDEFYADPQGYFKKKMQSIRDQVKQELTQDISAQQAEESLWREFFQAHPDLDGFKQDCELVAGQHADTIKLLAAKDRKKAMDYLATKTRAKFQDYWERSKPQEVLRRQQNAMPAGNTTHTPSVTPQNKNDDELDFVSQIRNMRGI